MSFIVKNCKELDYDDEMLKLYTRWHKDFKREKAKDKKERGDSSSRKSEKDLNILNNNQDECKGLLLITDIYNKDNRNSQHLEKIPTRFADVDIDYDLEELKVASKYDTNQPEDVDKDSDSENDEIEMTAKVRKTLAKIYLNSNADSKRSKSMPNWHKKRKINEVVCPYQGLIVLANCFRKQYVENHRSKSLPWSDNKNTNTFTFK